MEYRLPEFGMNPWRNAIRVLLVLSGVAGAGCFTQSNIPYSVTAANIRRVELGMSGEQVKQLLGTPVSLEPRDSRYYGNGAESLVYFHRLEGLWHYPMIWVHLSGNRVIEVYAKRHNTWDSVGVYGINAKGRWESPLFAETFP